MPPKGSKRKPVDPLKVIADLETKCTDLMNRENVGEFADVLVDSLKALLKQAKTHQIKEVSYDENDDEEDEEESENENGNESEDVEKSGSGLDVELTEDLKEWIVSGKDEKTDKMFFQLAESCEFHMSSDSWHDQIEIEKTVDLFDGKLTYYERYNGFHDMVGSDEAFQQISFSDPLTKKSVWVHYGRNDLYVGKMKEIFEACGFGDEGATFEQFTQFFDHLYEYLMYIWNRSSFGK